MLGIFASPAQYFRLPFLAEFIYKAMAGQFYNNSLLIVSENLLKRNQEEKKLLILRQQNIWKQVKLHWVLSYFQNEMLQKSHPYICIQKVPSHSKPRQVFISSILPHEAVQINLNVSSSTFFTSKLSVVRDKMQNHFQKIWGGGRQQVSTG